MSDREQAGLRGAVNTCVEETIFSNGIKFSITKEYRPDGKILSERHGNSDGSEWLTTRTYDDQGRLVKTTSGKSGEPGAATRYTYDDAGRSLSVTNDQNSDRTDFRYDEQGRKTAIHSFDPKTLEQHRNTAVGGSAWQAAVDGYGLPSGGTVVVLYDENDRETETQMRDANGSLVGRVVRSYDESGRITEEKPTWENPAALFQDRLPAEAQNQLNPAQQQAMTKALNALLRGQQEAGKVYSYDSQGRLTKVRESNFAFEKTTTIVYNDQGQKAEESEVFADNAVVPAGVSYSVSEEGGLIPSQPAPAEPSPRPLPEKSVIRYTYQYDSFGNWTEQTSTSGSVAGSPPGVCHRTITYY